MQIIMKASLFFILVVFSFSTFSSERKTKTVKCESGAIKGQIKTWKYNNQEVFEIYTNTYKRKYKIKSSNQYNIYAYENTKRGMYNVHIIAYKDIMKVSVSTPLANYTDINCKEIN